MTTTNSPEGRDGAGRDHGPDHGDDQVAADFRYGHGRMPFFMKLVWLAFLTFGAWYTVSFLLASVGEDLGG